MTSHLTSVLEKTLSSFKRNLYPITPRIVQEKHFPGNKLSLAIIIIVFGGDVWKL